jgi:endo-1,4-beta-xylanase
MVAFLKLVVSLATIAGSLASPANIEVPASIDDLVEERGPQDFFLRRANSTLSALARRQSPNYKQDYTTGGTVNYSPSSTGFSVQWSNAQDFVVGLGWTTGSNL